MDWTATNAAKEFGVSRETVLRGLRGLGIDTKQGEKYTTRQIHLALAGDLKAARTRETNVRADLLEIEKAKAEEKLLDPEIVNDRLSKCLGVIADYMRAAEVELPPACNPQDPEFARRAVVQWSRKFWPLIRGFTASPGTASPGEAWRARARQAHGGVTTPEDFAVEPKEPNKKQNENTGS